MTRFNNPGLVAKLDALTTGDELAGIPDQIPSIRYFGPSTEDDSVTVDITDKLSVDKLLGVQEETWKATVFPADSKAHDEFLDQVIAKNSMVKWPKFDFDRPLLPTDKIPVPDFMANVPEGGFKRGEMIAFAGTHPGYATERKSDLGLYMALNHAARNQGVRLHMSLEHDADFDARSFSESMYKLDAALAVPAPQTIGRGLTVPFLIADDLSLAEIVKYNQERAEGKIPSMIKGSETRTGQPKKHKAKKGGGKKKVRISPLLKNLLKGIPK